MLDFISIGDATLDTFLVLDESSSSCSISKDKTLLCLNYADKTPIEHSTQSVGGNAANVAVGLKRLGFSAAIVTELGDDFAGHILLEELENEEVDTTFVKMLKSKTTRYSIVLNYQTERTILSYYAPRSYTLPALPQSNWIYYTSLGKGFEGLQKKLVSHLSKHPNVRLAMNPGSYQAKHGLDAIMQLLPRTDVLFVNKEEAALMTGGRAKPIPAMLKSLYKRGPDIVVVTDSTQGSYAYDGEHAYYMGIYPVTPKAKTGAGDAYASGFLSALMSQKPIREAMKWGSANAASVIRQLGAQKGLATKSGIKKIIKEYPNVEPEFVV